MNKFKKWNEEFLLNYIAHPGGRTRQGSKMLEKSCASRFATNQAQKVRLDDIKTCKASFMRLYVFLFLKLSWIVDDVGME